LLIYSAISAKNGILGWANPQNLPWNAQDHFMRKQLFGTLFSQASIIQEIRTAL
jgi:uncharacterized membrane protein